MMPAVVRRQRAQATGRNVPRPQKTHTGACGNGCDCNACPSNGATNVTIGEIAALLGRKVAGVQGECHYSMIHLTNADRAAGMAAAAVETIEEDVQIGLCIQQVVVVTREVADPSVEGFFTFRNLMVANRQQWLLNRVYHQGLFGFDSECSCCLPGDCTTVGTRVMVEATNQGANAANVDFYLIGPSTN